MSARVTGVLRQLGLCIDVNLYPRLKVSLDLTAKLVAR
jgi:hypothetical protein